MAFQYEPYRQSRQAARAGEALQEHRTREPGEYEDRYGPRMEALQEQIADRKPFAYNVNDDPLYRQYRDMYTAQGRQAMQDTMGKAAALTGGYGSSYGQTAGQQQYNSSLQALNNIIPELYGSAYDRYTREGADLYDRYGLLADREAQDYDRYRDRLNRYDRELDRLQGVYDSERSFDYDRWRRETELDRDISEDLYTRLMTLMTAYGYTPTDRELEAAGMDRAHAEAVLGQKAAAQPVYYTPGAPQTRSEAAVSASKSAEEERQKAGKASR